MTTTECRVGDVRIELDMGDSSALRITWTGRSNDSDPGRILDPFHDNVLAIAQAKGKPVEVSFDRLEFFNSATIASIVRFIKKLRESKTHSVFKFDPRIRWQSNCVDALRIFERDGFFKLRDSNGKL